MGLVGKLSVQIEIKSKGDLFHQLWAKTPHQLSTIAPDKIHGCELVDGDWGVPGSTIRWELFNGEKEMINEINVIESVDEEKRCIKYKMVEAPVLEAFKTFTTCVQVETVNGEACSSSHVTWVLEYEKLNDDVPDPIPFLPLLISLTKDIEAYHLKNN